MIYYIIIKKLILNFKKTEEFTYQKNIQLIFLWNLCILVYYYFNNYESS